MNKVPNIRFMANLKKYLIISGIIMAVIVAACFVRGINLDIQFRGGAILTYSYEGVLDQKLFTDIADEVVGVTTTLQLSENISTDQQTVVVSLPGTQSLNADEMVEMNERLFAAFAGNNLQTLNVSNVDPTIGNEFLWKCLVAMVVASVLMMTYVAFRFRKIGGLSAGAMAVVALVHDVLVAFGVFVIFQIPVNDNFIAVVLTILGFSLNDTIVIYDRIRENERLIGKAMPLGDLVDLSTNQSFQRSLVTSGTTVISMVVVTVVALIYNVDSIMSFSFPLIVGLISGSYSSICLAGPLWVKWQERKAAKQA